jgi:hypothetical protein
MAQVQSVLQGYDFLFVVERLAESLVVLSWLTNLPVTQLLTLSAKQANSWYLAGGKRCIQLKKPVVTPAITTYLESSEWQERQYGDRLLWSVAMRSLDFTIEKIGRQFVQQQVALLEQWQEKIQVECSNQSFFPCSSSGQPQLERSQLSCYARDFGCGHQCIRDLVAASQSVKETT